MAETGLRLTGLRIYPVKSMAGNAVETAEVRPWGLVGDRRWALIDDTGKNVTARKVHQLLGLQAQLAGDTAIRITDRAGGILTVDAPIGAPTVAVGFRGLDRATPVGGEADAWLSARFDRSLRLVWQEDPTLRPIPEAHGGKPGDSLSLADDGPLLLVTEASMHRLNGWIAADTGQPDVPDIDPTDLSDDVGIGDQLGSEADADGRPTPLDIVRFRPNLIVDGDTPFAEDHWTTVWIGDVEFRRTMLCDRCVMTTIEPTTLAGGKEPIRTLARHRRWDGKTWFGIRLAPVNLSEGSAATISVGDPVQIGRN
ncbi:MAG: MOSC N-terminal beta barrel domain-containing protein [Terrimesophilobacter sp.]